jgi:hypothetical protein
MVGGSRVLAEEDEDRGGGDGKIREDCSTLSEGEEVEALYWEVTRAEDIARGEDEAKEEREEMWEVGSMSSWSIEFVDCLVLKLDEGWEAKERSSEMA